MKWYIKICNALNLTDVPEKSFENALARFRPLVVSYEVGGDIFGLPKGIHLEPVHSSIIDGIEDQILSKGMDFLKRVAEILLTIEDEHSWFTQTEIALYILSIVSSDNYSIQKAVAELLFSKHVRTSARAHYLLKSWKHLGDDFKKQLFHYINGNEKNQSELATECASTLNWIEIDEQDAWRIMRSLLNKKVLGVGRFQLHGNTWIYLFKHLDHIPPDLKAFLDNLADENSALFTFALGSGMVSYWDSISDHWKKAFYDKSSVSNPLSQEMVLQQIASQWDLVPSELKEHFIKQIQNINSKVRCKAAIWALIYREADPEIMDKIYMATLDEADIRIPLEVFDETSGDHEHGRIFAEALFERSNNIAAACILSKLLYRGFLIERHWKFELAKRCLERGGIFSQAVLMYYYLQGSEKVESIGFKPSDSFEGVPNIIQLAWVWDFANSDDKKRKIKTSDVKTIIEGLDSKCRPFALFYLSVQANYLPIELKSFLDELEKAEGDDSEYIKQGKNDRGEKNGRTMWGFPIQAFLPQV